MIDAAPDVFEVDEGDGPDLDLPLFSLDDREDLFARWRVDAACRGGLPAAWFYPERETGADNHGARAKAVCAGCPVRRECLASALRRREPAGIWGGAGEARRRGLLRAARTDPEGLVPMLAAHWRDLDGCPEDGDVALLASFGEGATHGRRVTYAKGCRCVACTWAASTLGVVLARLRVDTAVFWGEWSAGVPAGDHRLVVDVAARELVVDLVVGLMALGWRPITVAEGQAALAAEVDRRARWPHPPASGDTSDRGDRLAA
jgi:WhiB family redox-sensing transcriptional regulator